MIHDILSYCTYILTLKKRQKRIELLKWSILILLLVNQFMGWMIALTSQIVQSKSKTDYCTVYLRDSIGSFIGDYFQSKQQNQCQLLNYSKECGFQEQDCIRSNRIRKYFTYQLWVQLINGMFYAFGYYRRQQHISSYIYTCNTIAAFINFVGAIQLLQIQQDLIKFDNTQFEVNASLSIYFTIMAVLQFVTMILQFALFKEFHADQMKQKLNFTMPALAQKISIQAKYT